VVLSVGGGGFGGLNIELAGLDKSRLRSAKAGVEKGSRQGAWADVREGGVEAICSLVKLRDGAGVAGDGDGQFKGLGPKCGERGLRPAPRGENFPPIEFNCVVGVAKFKRIIVAVGAFDAQTEQRALLSSLGDLGVDDGELGSLADRAAELERRSESQKQGESLTHRIAGYRVGAGGAARAIEAFVAGAFGGATES